MIGKIAVFGLGFSAAVSMADANVSAERIVKADANDWLTYSGSYASWRYSKLASISRENVDLLRPVWVYQLQKPGLFECSPLVADNVMYIVEPPSTVTALDVHSGLRLWTWIAPIPKDVVTIDYPMSNRGTALLDGMVFIGTLDAHMVALDAATGRVRWNQLVADNRAGYGITCAPLAVEGKVLVGVSGGEGGIRGFLDAYDAQTGKRVWRFWTIPAPGTPGSDTWQGDSWKTGGGPTWVTGSYDPELKLVYWGVGNPGPDLDGDSRMGDNLYTCSIVALDINTGELRWHYQFTPHDSHDWDANQIPVLVDAKIAERPRKLLVTANRNGFLYLLDRQTGEFINATAFTKQTWNKGFDPKGRPMPAPEFTTTNEAVALWPELFGATNWFSPTYCPDTNLFYVAVREGGSKYTKSTAKYEPGKLFFAGDARPVPGDSTIGSVRAFTLEKGERKWEFPLPTAPWAGLLSTAGGLVFGGSNEGDIFALDAVSGIPLWHFQTGGAIRANPITFAVDGEQRVAIASGNCLFVFGLSPKL